VKRALSEQQEAEQDEGEKKKEKRNGRTRVWESKTGCGVVGTDGATSLLLPNGAEITVHRERTPPSRTTVKPGAYAEKSEETPARRRFVNLAPACRTLAAKKTDPFASLRTSPAPAVPWLPRNSKRRKPNRKRSTLPFLIPNVVTIQLLRYI